MKLKLLALFALIGTQACLPLKKESTSQSKYLVDKDISDEKVEAAIKEAKFALKINLTTNRLSYFKAGELAGQWNIATADVTGEFHVTNGVAEKQFTPTGIYTAHDIEHCPSWFPRNPFNPETNAIAENEEERMQIFKDNRDLFGPCGSKNPLGSYAMWFDGAYGVHGNAAEWILDLPVEDRRVSGGCVRNPNMKIKEVFNDIIAENFPDFKKKVEANIAKPDEEKETVTAYNIMKKALVHVIVGNWPSDPIMPGQKTMIKRVERLVPPSFEQLCRVKMVEPATNRLSIWAENPFRNKVGSYRKGQKVRVVETVNNFVFKTKKGYVAKNYLGDCIMQKPTLVVEEIEVPIPDDASPEDIAAAEKAEEAKADDNMPMTTP